MKMSERGLLLFSTVFLFLLSVLVFQLPQKDPLVAIDTTGQITLGDPFAPVHMILFEEFACTHCKHFHEENFPVIYEKYIQTGKVKITTIPMAYLESSAIPFATTTCAAEQGRPHNRAFVDYLFSLPQEKLLNSSARELLGFYASDHVDFRLNEALECIKSKKAEVKIEANRALIKEDTIEMPMIIINNRRLKKINLKEICSRIEEELHAKI